MSRPLRGIYLVSSNDQRRRLRGVLSSFAVKASRDKVLSVICQVFPNFAESTRGSPFQELEIDSFDLVTLRVSLEQQVAGPIADETWVSFQNLGDVLDYYAAPRRQ
jgi:acyl carrier protein